MVLQRNIAVPVWGWADDGESVTVTFGRQKVKAKVKSGRWMAELSKLSASAAPEKLIIEGAKNRIEINDVLVGEVWIASGQSNMEWPMSASFDAESEMAKATQPLLRLYTVPKLRAMQPTDNVSAKWEQCGPASVRGFSAVAYYFGRDVQKALGVPVGVIHTSWGGSPAEVWMSQRVLESNPRYKSEILDPYPAAAKQYQEATERLNKERDEAKAAGKPFNKNSPWAPWRPTELYNGMIAPLIPYAIQGAIWYQGESNAGRAEQYRSLFADMIVNWRKDWGQGSFPFMLVQLAPFLAIKPEPAESSWAELREAQFLATQTLPKVGMAVITDVGDEKDIHPKKKEPVGARLAIAARRIAYGQKIEHSGPQYRSMSRDGSKLVLRMDHAGGLKAANGEALKGFAIAGADRKFVWADAEIRNNTVVVSSPKVAQPVAARFGWADFPVVNLWNGDGLPAIPFRTDDFPMITAPKPPAKK